MVFLEANEKYAPANCPPIACYHLNVEDEQIIYYLQKGPCQPRGHDFPAMNFGQKDRRFPEVWFDEWPTCSII